MKTTFLNKWVIFVPLFAAVLFSACDKEENDDPVRVVDQPFTMTSATHPRISPIAPKPLEGQPTMIAYANAAGSGTGTATEMGEIKNWFNQLVYSPTGANPPTGSALAPIVEALNYPVLGAPLPLIQENDFDELREANTWIDIPVAVDGDIVNSVIYNDKGDAIFTSLTTDSKLTPASPTRVNFSAEGKFVGGRGKFANATGTYTHTGFFNPENFNEAGYNIEGKISY
ncbi:hypothetical protein [Pedobacter immunditicola]|uniref:hypothetical protein n=1 Tax=Pedobacter immunditicola TaxID=3133440 RepID=UPI0030A872AB